MAHWHGVAQRLSNAAVRRRLCCWHEHPLAVGDGRARAESPGSADRQPLDGLHDCHGHSRLEWRACGPSRSARAERVDEAAGRADCCEHSSESSACDAGPPAEITAQKGRPTRSSRKQQTGANCVLITLPGCMSLLCCGSYFSSHHTHRITSSSSKQTQNKKEGRRTQRQQEEEEERAEAARGGDRSTSPNGNTQTAAGRIPTMHTNGHQPRGTTAVAAAVSPPNSTRCVHLTTPHHPPQPHRRTRDRARCSIGRPVTTPCTLPLARPQPAVLPPLP